MSGFNRFERQFTTRKVVPPGERLMRDRAPCALLILLIALACDAPPAEDTTTAGRLADDAAPGADSSSAQIPLDWRYALRAGAERANRYLVSTESALATSAAAEVLAQGGNAFDAAVTAAFVLAVVYPEAGNLGGGGFAVLETADGSLAALDFRETAPAAARRDMFIDRDGKPLLVAGDGQHPAQPLEASKASHLAAGVPGSVAGLWALHEKLGSKSWEELVAPAVVLAEQGFPVDFEFVRSSREALPRLSRLGATRALFLRDGRPLKEGDHFENPELGRVLRRIATEGRAGFYAGQTARLIVDEMRRGGGLIDAQDLASYEPTWRSPVEIEYRGYKIVSMPPPSSGGVTLALIANMLAGYPLSKIGWHATEHLHLLAEAMSRAFADRNALLGDTAFVEVPLERLLSRTYADERRAGIGADATPATTLRAGLPPPEGQHTTHLAIVDEHGAAIALTTTINDLYGSGVTVQGGGFLLNNEMDDFTSRPGVPNLYGLVQGEANAIAPGKRMLSSMAPTLVLDAQGDVRIVAGARGGPRIISATWQVISNAIDFGMDAASAVNAPRVHHQWQPDELLVEQAGVLDTTRAELEARGHRVRFVPEVGNAPTLVRERATNVWTGLPDPRRGGAARGR
jgi:gamma-glutamyltranspeptidase/glutathione hydrolase